MKVPPDKAELEDALAELVAAIGRAERVRDQLRTTLAVVVNMPGVVTVSEANTNSRQHWAVLMKRKNAQKAATRLYLSQLSTDTKRRLKAAAKLRVRFVRIGGKKLDDDNARSAAKYIRDALAEFLGVDDKSDWYEWLPPVQESGERGVRIEMFAEGAE